MINPVRFERQAQHHQHLQNAVLSTHRHMAAAETLQRRATMLREDQKSNKNPSLKMLAGKGLSLENNCVKKSSKPDGDERLLQESPFPTRHHYFSQ